MYGSKVMKENLCDREIWVSNRRVDNDVEVVVYLEFR